MIRWRSALTRLVVRYGRHKPPKAAVSIDALLDTGFIAIDVETTGLDPHRDALVAVAAIPFVAGEARPGLVTLVNPGRPIPATATAIHGLSDADVEHAPTVGEVLPRFDALSMNRVLVGHDVGFDLGVLAAARATLGLPPRSVIALDTRRLVRAVGPAMRDSRLEVVAARFGVTPAGRHTADGDARMAGEIFHALLPALRARGARTVADLVHLQRATPLYD